MSARSLRRQLTRWLGLLVLGGSLAAALLAFWLSYGEANEFQDAQLIQMGRLLMRSPAPPPENLAPDTRDIDRDDQLHLWRLPVQPSAAWPNRLERLSDGLHTVSGPQGYYRVWIGTRPDGVRVALGELTDARDEAAQRAGLHTLLPLATLLPLVALAVALILRAGFRPVEQLTADLRRRADTDLSPLETRASPLEIQPFLQAINQLLARLQDTLKQQQRFIADAAHELRTPLTALKLQAANLETVLHEPEARRRLEPLKAGIERARMLASHLLDMARAQQAPALSERTVRLDDCVKEALAASLPLAAEKAIDLGLDRLEPVSLTGDAIALATLARNLMDNAVRYSPAGSRIDVRVYRRDGAPVLEIQDQGPGIPDDEQARVFEPFHRIPGSPGEGSGRGLAIVAGIARHHGAQVSFANLAPGLLVRCVFPSATETTS